MTLATDVGPSLLSYASALLGRGVRLSERLAGGRNSRIYRLTAEDGRNYAAKLYAPGLSKDGRDRMAAEFASLQFLWSNGVRCVPQPLAIDRDARCALYGFAPGERPMDGAVTESDIDRFVEFVGDIAALNHRAGARGLPPAGEACFCIKEIFRNLTSRLERLSAVQQDGQPYDALRAFLRDELVPAFEGMKSWCRGRLEHVGLSFSDELPLQERTLSPSDFGFHNALKDRDGRITFIDFEHFGWDDPAKTVSDFLVHPGVEIDDALKQRFFSGALRALRSYDRLADRVEMVYPLFGLKWCFIYLNEFLPEDLMRRDFAADTPTNRAVLQATQLEKSRRLLKNILETYEHFPYHR